jgi:hypothetical protein
MPPITTGVVALHDHLRLTAERPVETGASRWLGEAEAIVGDLAQNQPIKRHVMQERLTRVQELLAEVQHTGDPIAEHHLELARQVTDMVQNRLAENR